ncbi:MAG: TraM recognition domain-containing protein, partial [Bryobacteraceae bacterium]
MPEPQSRSSEPGLSPEVLLVFGLAITAAIVYWILKLYHVTDAEMKEVLCYTAVPFAAVVFFLIHRKTVREKRERGEAWPPFVVPRDVDQRELERAWEQSGVLIGYDPDHKPFIWHDETRVMQGLVLGNSGQGKTTLLKSIITQDLERVIGAPEQAHRLPMVIFDGKGDLDFFQELLPYVQRAGRMHQLRLINPARPDISVYYNPFYSPKGEYNAHAGMVFKSFGLPVGDGFHPPHQLSYLRDAVRILYYTRKIYNVYDVLVFLLDEDVMREQIDIAQNQVRRDEEMTEQQRLNFKMSVRKLLQSFEDRERVPKIQGLINEMMNFLDDDMSVITGQYQDLLTIEDVIDQELILFVSLNANKDTEPVVSLGRMILQDIQVSIGRRYESETHRNNPNQPMFSVVMDEFAPFAYQNFAHILQTARGAKVAFLFSMQNVSQLLKVGRGFQADVSAAPSTVMTFMTRDESTAKYFRDASAQVQVMRRSRTLERRGLFGFGKYRETGRAVEMQAIETRARDERLKNLAKGQIQVLMTDATKGTVHAELMVRPPTLLRLHDFTPELFPQMRTEPDWARGANIRFKDPELSDKYRVPRM